MTKTQQTAQAKDCLVPIENTSTPPPTPPDKFLTGDGLLTLILIALGTLGLYHVGSNYEQPSVYNTNISPSDHQSRMNVPFGASTKINIPQDFNTKKTYSNQLIISGKPEVIKQLEFLIDSFDENVRYTIDLGNGDVIEPRERTAYYAYPVSGSYLVELIATYKGQETVLYSDFVDIYNSVELVSAVDY